MVMMIMMMMVIAKVEANSSLNKSAYKFRNQIRKNSSNIQLASSD
jgi:hypothetical protein